MPKASETVLEIDLSALTSNFNYLKSKITPDVKFMAVVKAFAYGSDAVEIAKHLETLTVDYFAVAYVAEGVALRNAGITTPILVLHPQLINFNTLIERCLEPCLFNFSTLTAFIKTAEEKKQSNYPVHIKFNTGLNRMGFRANDIDEINGHLKRSSALKITSLFSHLAASEDANEKSFTNNQIALFKDIAETFKKTTNTRPFLHMANTSGILNYPEAHFNMVRSGIGLYGFGNSDEYNNALTPISTLKSVISQIQFANINDSIGYNRSHLCKRPTKIATVPIGHADGINRIYGNGKGGFFVKNTFAPILGNVCMDMVMIDVTDIDCKEGDEVVVFDKNTSRASHLAERANTISYELITGISQRIKRTFVK